MKIKEYVDRLKMVKKFERSYLQFNYKMVCGMDTFGNSTVYQERITYNKLSLGTSNLREHANPNFDVEQELITNEKRRLGL